MDDGGGSVRRAVTNGDGVVSRCEELVSLRQLIVGLKKLLS